MHHPRLGRAALATLAASAVALTAAPAAHAGPHTGCYRPTADRILRVIPKGQACLQGERRISWNNTRDGGAGGQRGPRGLQGPSGAKGDKGDAGATGAAGAAGAKGDTGAAGAAGAAGAKGEQGEQGLQGLQGVQGAVGAPGPQGLQGIQGEQGEQGVAGAAGQAGAAGDVGPQGPVGPQGIDGPQGPQGEIGPQGPAGPQGDPGAAGTPGAAGEDGAPGAGTIFSANSGLPAVATSDMGGVVGTVSTLPLSGTGLETGVAVNSGSIARITAPTGFDHGQVVARNGTITAVAGQATTSAALSLVGSTVTETVSVWRATSPGGSYSQIPGASATLAPARTGVIPVGQAASGITTGLSIPVAAGDRLLVVYSITSTGLTLINTLSARVTSSVAIS